MQPIHLLCGDMVNGMIGLNLKML